MLKKFVIAAAAIASMVTLASVPAKAESNISVGIGFGFGGGISPDYGSGISFYDGGYDSGYDSGYRPRHRRPNYDDTYYSRVSCSGGARLLRRAGYRDVEADDCTAPVYTYQASKHGEDYDIQVSSRGRIISVDPAY